MIQRRLLRLPRLTRYVDGDLQWKKYVTERKKRLNKHILDEQTEEAGRKEEPDGTDFIKRSKRV